MSNSKKHRVFYIPTRTKGLTSVYTPDELYREYAELMIKNHTRKFHNKMDAEDVVHTTFVKLLRHWNNINWMGNVEGFISRTFSNSSKDFYKTEGGFRKPSIDDLFIADEANDNGLNDPLVSLLFTETKEKIHEAFAVLSPSERAVATLYYVDGVKLNDMRGNHNTRKVQLMKARKKICHAFHVEYWGDDEGAY